jgi:general secretion pathway protein D
VTIIPDPRANSLLIRASRSDFDLVAAAVRELDVRPLQVLIELMIAEVRHDRALGFGVEAVLPKQNLPGSGTSISATTAGAGLGDFVLKLMSIGGLDVDATLRAAASRGDVSILSRPVVITANNHAAEILVGSQRPFVQVSRTLPTDSPLRDQVIQYKEVGTKLSVLPTISDDGYIMLEVTQEVNAATAETQFDAPVISTRLVQTRLLVKDGQTVALGGLTDRQRDANTSGVPLLSAIPGIGGLFGRSSRRTSETELFLFLSPRVLRSDEDADNVTQPLKQRAEKLKP